MTENEKVLIKKLIEGLLIGGLPDSYKNELVQLARAVGLIHGKPAPITIADLPE